MSYVKLAIRVRPLHERNASANNSSTVVTVESSDTVAIRNPKVQNFGAGDSRTKIQKFSADYCFDSSIPEDDLRYSTQEKVYETLGPEILKSLEAGRSVCVVAYGQSGTGKTYTMMGTPDNPGLIPRLCRDICKNISESVVVSYLEIYNERVHDLLTFNISDCQEGCSSLPRRCGNSGRNLRIREHPNSGIYVQNLRSITVQGEEALLSLISTGTSRRRTAATAGHHLSSRSHALLALKTAKGTIYLADLAGSEKANSEANFRGRLKEGANINKSLVALSNVINALVSRGWRSRYVPYRDSVLTWLLKDSFSCGGSTFIIATVSPDSSSYGPSLSTLRWAARARKLPLPKPGISSATIRVTALLKALTKNHIQYIAETGAIICDPKYWRYIFEEHFGLKEDVITQGDIGEMDKDSKRSSSVDRINKERISIVNNKHIDKVLGPILHRTSSDNEINSPLPTRNRHRKYRSHEILPIKVRSTSEKSAVVNESKESLSTQSHQSESSRKTSRIYDTDRRAAIVASVTERLYNKIKKKKDSAAEKLSNELNACTNAKTKLAEFGQRVRIKRRVTNSTQTSFPVLRVKDQSIDIQTDLDTFYVKKDDNSILYKNVRTETDATTARCKEVGVGRIDGSIHRVSSSTVTETPPLIVSKSSGMMTENCNSVENSTQTSVKPPPRKKKSKTVRPDLPKSTAVVNINVNCSNEDSVMSEDSIEVSKNGTEEKHNYLEPECIIQNNTKESDLTSDSDDSIALPSCAAAANSFYSKRDFSDIILGRNQCFYPYNITLSPFTDRKESLKKVSFVTSVTDSKTSTIGTQTNISNVMNSEKRKTDTIAEDQSDSYDMLSLSGSETSSSFEHVEHNLRPSSFVKTKKKIVPHNEEGPLKLAYRSQIKSNHMKYDVNNEIRKYAKINGSNNYEKPQPVKLKPSIQIKANAFLTNYLKNIQEEEPPVVESSSSEQDYTKDFLQKKTFFENYINENCRCYQSRFQDNDDFQSLEKNLLKKCNTIEHSLDKHRKYFENRAKSYLFCDTNKADSTTNYFSKNSPSEYLLKLIDIRKKLVEDEKNFAINTMF